MATGTKSTNLEQLALADELIANRGGSVGRIHMDNVGTQLAYSGAIAERLAGIQAMQSVGIKARSPVHVAPQYGLGFGVPSPEIDGRVMQPGDSILLMMQGDGATVTDAGNYLTDSPSNGVYIWQSDGNYVRRSDMNEASEFYGSAFQVLEGARANTIYVCNAAVSTVGSTNIHFGRYFSLTSLAAGFATSAQGAKADSAVQPLALASEADARGAGDASLTAGLAETDNAVFDLGVKLSDEEAARVAAITAVVLDLLARGVAVGPTNDPEIAWGVGFAGDDKRSWLEILRATGGPTGLAARLIARALNFNDLTSEQLDLLASLLNIDMNLSDLSEEDVASLVDQLDLDFQNPSPELIAAVQDIAGNPNPDIIKVATAAPIISLSTEPHGPSREYPVWVKHLSAPVIALADAPGQGSFYWPCLVGLAPEGLDGYAIFQTTDHAQVHEDSGVIMFTAPHPNGPWTYRGKIYRDDNPGSLQTETAVPMWIKGTLHIFYQAYSAPPMGTGTQTSLYVTLQGPLFPNGIDNPPVNWIDNPEAFSAPKVAFDNFTDKYPGTGHTGYLTPFQLGADVFAHALQGGAGSGANSFCQWDDKTPDFDATFVPFPRRVMQESGTLIGTPAVMKNGQIYKMSPKRAMRIGRGGAVIGTTIDITPPAQAWEEGLVIMGATTVTVDGETFAAYRGGSTNSTHKIGIKKAV